MVLGPQGLAGQPDRAHPQKAEHPIDGRQDHSPDPNRANRRWITQLANHACIDDPQQGHRHIRQDDWHRNLENALIGKLRCGYVGISHPIQASRNAPWPARRGGHGYPAMPRHAHWHSAAPSD